MRTFSKFMTIVALAVCSLTACTGAELDKNATSPQKAETYQLVRDWKRVTRYNCAGEVTSDQIETVRSPNKFMTIQPKSYQGLYSARFVNLTNHSQAGVVSGNNSFTMDMAPSWLNMQVEEGLNVIQYEFYDCDEFKKDPTTNEPTRECKHAPELRESGYLYLRIQYIQNWLDGQDVVKPSDEECKQIEEKTKDSKSKS